MQILKIAMSLALLTFSLQTFAAVNKSAHSGWPGFFDHFSVNIQSSAISPEIIYTGNSGGIYVSQSNCYGNTCNFTVTDGGSAEKGDVYLRVGDQNGPHCDLDVQDGAWMPDATLNASCSNGASMDNLQHVDTNQYEVDMYIGGAKAAK